MSNQLQPGDTVPPEWELAELYGVSRLTVRRALDDLVRQDWLNRRQGVGTFVSRPAVTAISPSQLSFTQEMLAIGRRPSSRLLEKTCRPGGGLRRPASVAGRRRRSGRADPAAPGG